MNTSSNLSRISAAAILAGAACTTGGCYLLESADGELALLAKREPIAKVIERPATPPALRTQLAEVQAIRDFASRELSLPDNGSYRSYVDIRRRYVVWNVVAAPEFSVEPRKWCFPIVGCVAYRGYFKEHRARWYAASLHKRGFDVSVGGVAAYSTLGHFDDPILSSMLEWNDIELASIIFHELTHQLLYLRDDASFNEALATTVEEEGVRRWLTAGGRSEELHNHLIDHDRYLKIVGLLRRTRGELESLYDSGADPRSMRSAKQAILARSKDSYEAMTAPWGAHPPFETWFDGRMNNADLASIATYYDCVPGFERELLETDRDLPAFFQRVRTLAALPRLERDAAVCEST